MWWPWSRTDKELEEVIRENAEVKEKVAKQEETLECLRKQARANSFGARLHEALGGRPRNETG
jgi:hypothetical protein